MTEYIATSHAGHGNQDKGVVTYRHEEAAFARIINRKIIQLTKAVDCTIDDGRSVMDTLQKIVEKTNANCHHTSFYNLSHHLTISNGKDSGVRVLYWKGNQRLRERAEELSFVLSRSLGIPNRGVQETTNSGIHQQIYGNVLEIEWGFIDNPSDMQALTVHLDKAIREALSLFGYTESEYPKDETSKRICKKVLPSAQYFAVTSNKKLIPKEMKGQFYYVLATREITHGRSDAVYLLGNKEGKSIGWVLSQDVEGGYDSQRINPLKKDYSHEYYVVAPKAVKLKQNQGLRSPEDVEFKGKSTFGGSYRPGTVFRIVGLKYSADGIPRLVTSGGFLLSANRTHVTAI